MRFDSTLRHLAFAGVAFLTSSGSLVYAGNPEAQAFRAVHGHSENTGVGFFVASVGDINLDGVPDYAITLIRGNGLAGMVKLYSGADGEELQTLVGQAWIDLFGMSVAAAGDIDHDGVGDLVIGSPLEANLDWESDPPTLYGLASSVQTYSGKTGVRLVRVVQDDGEQWRDGLGWSVTGAGDMNGDGTPDFIAAAPFWTDYKGRLFGFSGTNGAGLYQSAPTGTAGQFGFSLSNAGDLNSDGHDDIFAGSPASCRAVVLDTHNQAVIRNISVGSSGGFLGDSVANAGDVNGDGVNDLIVGGKNAARVVVYSGADWQMLRDWRGAAGSQFGYAVANAGDFSGDGVNDIAVGAPSFKRGFTTYGRVFVYSGAGGGLLAIFEGAAGTHYFGMSVAGVGDINSDGFDDLLIGAPGQGGAAYIYVGGQPTLGMSTPSSYYTRGATPATLITADINHDGWADVMSVNPTTGKLAVQANKRNGTFYPATLYDVGKGANSVVAADLDNDGDLDVVVTTTTKLCFLRNYGMIGQLAVDGSLAVTGRPMSIVAGDFNDDGFNDLAVVNKNSGTVSVMLNNRNQSQRFQFRFAKIKSYNVGLGAVDVRAGDMDDDGYTDLVIANPTTDEISVLLNKGTGWFFPRSVVAAINAPNRIALGDFNLDGRLDIACICTGNDNITIFSNAGDNTYAASGSYPAGRNLRGLVATDIDADGLVDLAVANATDNKISLLMNGGGGQFAPAANFGTHTNPVSVGCADFDGDGDCDVVSLSGNTGWMSVLMNRWIY